MTSGFSDKVENQVEAVPLQMIDYDLVTLQSKLFKSPTMASSNLSKPWLIVGIVTWKTQSKPSTQSKSEIVFQTYTG